MCFRGKHNYLSQLALTHSSGNQLPKFNNFGPNTPDVSLGIGQGVHQYLPAIHYPVSQHRESETERGMGNPNTSVNTHLGHALPSHGDPVGFQDHWSTPLLAIEDRWKTDQGQMVGRDRKIQQNRRNGHGWWIEPDQGGAYEERAKHGQSMHQGGLRHRPLDPTSPEFFPSQIPLKRQGAIIDNRDNTVGFENLERPPHPHDGKVLNPIVADSLSHWFGNGYRVSPTTLQDSVIEDDGNCEKRNDPRGDLLYQTRKIIGEKLSLKDNADPSLSPREATAMEAYRMVTPEAWDQGAELEAQAMVQGIAISGQKHTQSIDAHVNHPLRVKSYGLSLRQYSGGRIVSDAVESPSIRHGGQKGPPTLTDISGLKGSGFKSRHRQTTASTADNAMVKSPAGQAIEGPQKEHQALNSAR
jgi:hypothetical protein